jgi:flagellar M-ring protein FliF
MGGSLDKAKRWWLGSDRASRVTLLGGGGGLLLLLVFAMMFAMRPHYETLFANLNDQEQSTVAADLQGMGFDVKFDRPGLIEVPASEKASARMRLASANKLPHAQGQWDNEQLNTTPFGMTPGVEEERLKAIAEGEIAKSIESMDGISSARVNLTIPPRSVFASEQKAATASVSIVESGDTEITPQQGRAIALLVKNAVDGLDTKDIVVVDQHLKTIWNGEDEADGGGVGAGRKADMDESVSLARQRQLQSLLDGAFGANAAIVTVHADVDMDPSKTVSVKRTPTGTASTQTQSEQVSGQSSKAIGIAGTTGNLPNPPAITTSPSSGSYTGQSSTKENAVSEEETDSSHAIGGIKAMAINVVVDSARIPDPKAVESILYGDLGDKIKLDGSGQPVAGQPYSVKVTSVEFDKTAEKQAAQADKDAASQARMQQILSMLPIGALLLVAAMVLKQVAKFARAQTASAMPSSLSGFGGGASVALPDSGSLSNLLAQIESSQAVSGGGEGGGGLSSSPAFVHIPRPDEPPIEVEDIKNRVHIPLEQLKKMANERPALVAALIKSMILEERK